MFWVISYSDNLFHFNKKTFLFFIRTKKPAAIAPLLPLTFIVGYQGDLAYGSKVNRIKAEAENIMQYERDLIEIPSGLPTLSSIDAARIRAQVMIPVDLLNSWLIGIGQVMTKSYLILEFHGPFLTPAGGLYALLTKVFT